MEVDFGGRDERGLAAFEAFLCAKSLTHEQLGSTTLAVPGGGVHGILQSVVDVSDDRAVVDSLYSFTAPVARRLRVMTLAARINHRLDFGALTVDPDDGEVALRTAVPIGAARITVAIAAEVMERHWHGATSLLPAVAALVFAEHP